MREKIAGRFEGKAFLRPLFYSYPGGLRFELAEGASAIERFLVALRKATTICADIFPEDTPIVACLRAYAGGSGFAHRHTLMELRNAGIRIPREREVWVDTHTPSVPDGASEESWINVAFEAPRALLPNLLWCALAADFGHIRPHPLCSVYLFNLDAGIMTLPYDDRGMDVVGPNHAALAALYFKHRPLLLDYDRVAMAATFERGPNAHESTAHGREDAPEKPPAGAAARPRP